MKCLIVLVLAAVAHADPIYQFNPYASYNPYAVPVVTPEGFLADTPEVAAAKVAHFAEHAKALAASAPIAAPLFAAPVAPVVAAPLVDYNAYRFQAIPGVTPEGFLADTPEVAAAKVAHFAEHAKALAATAPAPLFAAPVAPVVAAPVDLRFQAIPAVTADGFVTDTAEVAAAKNAHYAEVLAAGVTPHHLYQEYHNTFRSSPFYNL